MKIDHTTPSLIRSIENPSSSEFTDRGSRFLGYLFPCADVEIFEDELDKRKHEYRDATHHCYAWRIMDQRLAEYSNDDGEPSGSAGKPILNRLKSYELCNVALVVTRFFGGTKLGKAGLIGAYGTCADSCLKEIKLVKLSSVNLANISFPYPETVYVEKIFRRYKVRIIKSSYDQTVTHRICCRSKYFNAFSRELTAQGNRNIIVKPDPKSRYEKM